MIGKILIGHGDRLEGERIYAEFRKFQPKCGYTNDEQTGRKKTTLLTTVYCTIVKPIRKKDKGT